MSQDNIDKPMNDSGLTELHLGAYHQELEWVENCIKAGFDVNKQSNNGYTPLTWVIDMYCTTGDPEESKKIVDILIENGANVNHNPTVEPTLLEFAKSVHPEIYKHLKSKKEFNV